MAIPSSDLTQIGYYHGQTLDAYIWTDDSGIPGEVMCVTVGIDPGPITMWPSVSRHVIPLSAPCYPEGSW